MAMESFPGPENHGAASVNTLVSLYLLLLTFFIALQALAEHQPLDARRTLDSVRAAFGDKRVIIPRIAPDLPFEGSFEAELERLMRQAFGIAARSAGGAAREEVGIAIDPAYFFAPASIRLRGDRQGALGAVARYLATSPKGEARRLSILAMGADGLATQRAIALGLALQAQGAPSESIVLARRPDAEDGLVLRFARRPAEPRP
ncbi:MAG: hypothetical protein ACOY99_02875 [Pseudomonadota bacterium]